MTVASRRRPTARTQARVLDEQHYRCLYCTLPFGTLVRRASRRGAREELTRLEWDHFVPYALAGRNPEDNWAAACHVCNGLKSDHVFADVIEARNAILVRWTEVRIAVLWVPTVSSEEDTDAWAAEHAERRKRLQPVRSTVVIPPVRRRRRGFVTCPGCGEDFKPQREQLACSDNCWTLIKQRRARAQCPRGVSETGALVP